VNTTHPILCEMPSGEAAARLRVACKTEGVPEIFLSIQGEGRNVGQIRSFLRLSGCNLQCRWCDTPYTWNWEGTHWPGLDDAPNPLPKYRQAREMLSLTVPDLAARLSTLSAPGLVITGGEPLVQMRGLLSLIRALKAADPALLIEIETNGTIAPGAELAGLVDLFMVSPKLDHALNREGRALRAGALAALAALPAAAFKFVAAAAADVAEVAILAREHSIAPGRIYIMPLGTSSDALIRTGAALIDSVIAHGFNYSDRLHIHLFGEKRGT
jgi:organic radical activating enzyme